ncbi:MAG TPA: DUF2975 domain-containing protein [Aliicoccus persicus]|uniref:DUF2975 domain-containing protein n=1 Tax=Aliicoccus persicus TaxID=930138 RepID=A0A921DXG2_9STAP|nr:DUF2975 domain-containing protein [Aliicoccus persicus]
MEPVKAEKQFNKFVSLFYVLSFIPVVVLSLAVVGIVIGIIVVLVAAESIVNLIQNVPFTELTVELEQLGLLSNEVTENLVINQLPIILVMLSSMVVMFLLISITIFINRWLKNLKEGHYFDEKNSKYVEYVGYTIITLSIWYGVQELAGSYMAVDFFESNPEIMSHFTDVLFDFSDMLTYSFSIDIVLLFIGVLVWMIGRVFKYGTYLQNEYDQTV